MEELSGLILAAQAGDSAACAALVARFQDMAYSLAYEHLHDYHLAQDVVQEAFIEAFTHLDQIKERAAFPGWFRRIVFYQCTRMLRRPSLEILPLSTAMPVPGPESDPARTAEAHEIQGYVRGALSSLPLHERLVTDLFYLSQYSQKEISELLDIPVTTVKKRLYSARQRLKATLHSAIAEGIADAIRRVSNRPVEVALHLLRLASAQWPFPGSQPALYQ